MHRYRAGRPAATAFALAILALAVGCGGGHRTVKGTRIADNAVNRALLDTIEAYRQAVERRDSPALMLMASPNYHEDSGSLTARDDYGITKLKTVLDTRFQAASDIRFSMRYVSVRRACPSGHDKDDLVPGCKAQVEVLVDASFTVIDARNQERRPDKRDQNMFELEWSCAGNKEGCKWLFVSGM
jgi:hypothetical protein